MSMNHAVILPLRLPSLIDLKNLVFSLKNLFRVQLRGEVYVYLKTKTIHPCQFSSLEDCFELIRMHEVLGGLVYVRAFDNHSVVTHL